MAETTHESERREALSRFLQKEGGPDIPEGSLCVGWAIVVEWMTPEGDKNLSRVWSVGQTSWGANGMFHEALCGDWDNDDA